VQKLEIHGECLFFPKADVQTSKNQLFSGAAFGHKRTFVVTTALLSESLANAMQMRSG
jgi:hypothetical protein